jgi:hypothetical protein
MASKAKRARLEECNPDSFVVLERAFDCNLITYYYKTGDCNKDCNKDIELFLCSLREQISKLLMEQIENNSAIKFNLIVECTYEKYQLMEGEVKKANLSFKTKNLPIFNKSEVDSIITKQFEKLRNEESEFYGKGSGWSLVCIEGLMLRINRYKPLRGSSHLNLPKSIIDKRAVVNIKNKDLQCFKWSILCKYVTGRDRDRLDDRYKKIQNKYDFSMIEFPTDPLRDVAKFERANDVSVNVYVLKDNLEIKPLKVCAVEKADHFDLLFLKNENTQHCCYISDFSRLVRSQLTKDDHAITVCKRCFTFYKTKDPKLNEKWSNHLRRCVNSAPAHIKMPPLSKDGSPPILKFKNYQNMFPTPIVAYVDFECILKPVQHYPSSMSSIYTRVTDNHEPMSYCLYFVCHPDVDDSMKELVPDEPLLYRGPDAAKHFMKRLSTISCKLAEKLRVNAKMIFTRENENDFNASIHCEMCHKKFDGDKVRDHCHFTGTYRTALCNSCNIRRTKQNSISVFAHNLSNYDSHFIVRELDYDTQQINVIPSTKENFITFSKRIADNFQIKFIDTFRFMAASLDKLSSNLPESKFHHTKRHFGETSLPLVTRKGVFPYEYTNSWAVLQETTLPPKEKFYSKLIDADISDEDYTHAQTVWNHFGCQTLGEYSDVYLHFENNTYVLDVRIYPW